MVYSQNGMMKIKHRYRRGCTMCHPTTCHSGALVILSCKAPEKQKMLTDTFSDLPLSAWRQSLQKELCCHKSLPWEFYQPGKIDSYHRRRDENLTPYLDRLCHKISSLPSLLPRVHLSFLKIISSPLRGLGPLSPLPITMVLKPEF